MLHTQLHNVCEKEHDVGIKANSRKFLKHILIAEQTGTPEVFFMKEHSQL